MALENFRVEGLGQVSHANIDLADTTAFTEVIGQPTSNDHTVNDNWDKDGSAIVWTQPQPRIEIYKLMISADTASAFHLGNTDSTSELFTMYANGNFGSAMGSDGLDGKLPLFVCDVGDNFGVTPSAICNAANVYVQYRLVTPRN